jgi:sodium pump decarboxylase gamma subunit
VKAVESLESASEDMGSYMGIMSTEATVDEESAVINVTVDGSSHDAVIEVIVDENGVESITTNVKYSFGESMEKAALNTLLGMGTVFVVLILICFIISGFKFISVLENRGKNKEADKAEAPKAAPAPAPAPVAAAPVQEENLTDDLELVAVIAAAIAASEGRTTTDGLVVRSIRKANKNKWQNAV